MHTLSLPSHAAHTCTYCSRAFVFFTAITGPCSVADNIVERKRDFSYNRPNICTHRSIYCTRTCRHAGNWRI